MSSDTRALMAQALAAGLRPPPRLSLSEWADQHFVMSSESSASPGRWTTLPFQREILDAMTDPRVTSVSLVKSARIGWALALDTPIPTPSGWTTMGEVLPGDLVFGRSGKPTRVVYKSPVFTDHDCWEVTFCDGERIVADSEHRWFVESDVAIEAIQAGTRGRTGHPRAGESKSFAGVLTTKEIAREMTRGRSAIAVPNACPLDTPPVDLPVPPYVLGAWLGDGDTLFLRITQHRTDAEDLASLIRGQGVPVFVCYRDKKRPDNASLLLGRADGRRRKAPLAEQFRALGLLGGGRTKFIPSVYLRAAPEQRLALLRGLMDTDGSAAKNGRAEFSNTNKDLSYGVYELAVSLGCKASITERRPQRPGWLPQWRVSFRPPPGLVPFALERKARRVVSAPSRPTINTRRRIRSVAPVASVSVQCLSVDAEDHLFLAGRGMVPTHNTLMCSAAIAYWIAHEPSSILYVLPRVDDAKSFSKETVGPLFRDVPLLRAIKAQDEDSTNAEGTMLHKLFPGGVLSLVGANSGAGLRRISRRVVMLDEVDAMPASAGDEGDPVRLATKRAEAFWNRKHLAGSTPLITGASRIETLFLAGDQRRYHVPCPHCGHAAPMVFTERPNLGWHYVQWDDGHPETAHLVCGRNGCVIDHSAKRRMIEQGRWVAEKPFEGHASFAINALYSYSPNATWADIAKEFLQAKAEGADALRTFVNTTLGESWREQGDAPDWEKVMGRTEAYALGTVPAAVKFLTAGVDVQKDRLVVTVTGWGGNRECWIVDYQVLLGATAEAQVWLDLDGVIDRTYDSEDHRVMQVAGAAIDAGYNTQLTYDYVRRHPGRGLMAIVGRSGARALVGTPSPVDVTHNGRKIARGARVWPIGIDVAKGDLYGRLQLPRPEEGAPVPGGWVHFPSGLDAEFYRQLTAETQVLVTSKRGFRSLEWRVQPGRENHVLDTWVYARAAAATRGVDRMPAGAASVAPPAVPAAAPVAPPVPVRAPSPVPVSAPPPAPPPRPKTGSWLNGGRPRRGGWLR